MNIQTHHINNTEIAEVRSEDIVIQNANDALDLMGNIYYQGFDKIVIHQKNLTEEFFNLKNKMAGEILQKFSNYRIRLAIVGDYSKFSSKSLQDFIYESNKGKDVYFATSLKDALRVLSNSKDLT